jgi:D-beta-D-heptose 7-phosphate kinase/D-beta-D-heptose 1-phosphate adenosyltransferase
MLDKYRSGRTERISEEAPVLILDTISTTYNPGGASNVAMNLKNIGVKVSLWGRIGYDDDGRTLKWMLEEENIDFRYDCKGRTIVKERIISNNQQLLRIDDDCIDFLEDKTMTDEIMKNIPRHDLIILSDYGKGF